MFGLSVFFRRGLCVAAGSTKYDTEYPLHPSRIYAALVATAGATGRHDLMDVLRELESDHAGLPEIHVGQRLDPVQPVTIYRAVLGKPNEAKCAQIGAHQAQERVSLNPRTEHVSNYAAVCRPAVRLREPWMVFMWPHLDPSEKLRAALETLCPEIGHLGTGESLVEVRPISSLGAPGAPDCPLPEHYIPDGAGDVLLRVAAPGTLNALNAAFERGKYFHGWVREPYRRSSSTETNPGAWRLGPRFSLKGAPVHVARALLLTERLRVAVLGLERRVPGLVIPSIIHGHDHPGAHHVALVPLSYSGPPHGDGLIRGIGLALPRSCTVRERDEIGEVARAMENMGFRMGGDDFRLERLPADQGAACLRSKTWCRPSRTWATVTPLVLDDWPDPKAEDVVFKACLRAGLPAPAEVEFGRTPFVGQGAVHSSCYKGISRRCAKTGGPRLWGHARITWENPVEGPILLGRLRHFGMGVLLPLDYRNRTRKQRKPNRRGTGHEERR